MNTDHLSALARMAATSDRHWNRLFEALRAEAPVDRICAAVKLDAYTAYLPRVAQIDAFAPLVGETGLYADREVSCTFDVIENGTPHLAAGGDWKTHPDLAFYAIVVKSNMKFPIALGGAPAVLNVWSAQADAFTPADLDALTPVAAELSRSPFQLELAPVGLSLRRVKDVVEARTRFAAAA